LCAPSPDDPRLGRFAAPFNLFAVAGRNVTEMNVSRAGWISEDGAQGGLSTSDPKLKLNSPFAM